MQVSYARTVSGMFKLLQTERFTKIDGRFYGDRETARFVLMTLVEEL